MAKKTGKVTVKTGAKKPAKAVAPAPKEKQWHPFLDLWREVDHMFDEFSSNLGFGRLRGLEPAGRFPLSFAMKAPAVDVIEEDKRYRITAELPGLSEKDIEVSLAEGVLTLKGEKTKEKEEKQKDYHLSERHYGAFRRSFRLPDGIDTDKVDATFKNGVLTIDLPKQAAARRQEKKITVKVA